MPTSTDIAALRSEAFGISRLFEAEKFIEKVIGLLEAERQRTENWKASFENERIRADKLAAHIDALKGDQVPVAVVDIQHGRADGNLFAVTLTKAGHALKDDVYELFTAPQKPVVLLNSSTVMSRGYVVKQIEAAGCTVESNEMARKT